MGTNSKIEWTDHTWNPWRGCSKVSPGCDKCYMYRDAKRYGIDPVKVVRCSFATFRTPLVRNSRHTKGYKWADGEKVFVCSWSDFFHHDADAWRGEAWEIIRQRPGLIFQILTKRQENILSRLPADWGSGYPNVWLGVTVENQEQADRRVSILLSIPGERRFVSIEPMLGPVDLNFKCPQPAKYDSNGSGIEWIEQATPLWKGCLDWVICGGESGPNARPMHPDWARPLRDQCQAAGVPFFFKQMTGKGLIPDDLMIREFPA